MGIFDGKYAWAGSVDDGDCSLIVIDADREFDSGGWQCAVTASSFRSKDALVSTVGILVVRKPPSDIFIRILDGTVIDDIINVVENTSIRLECVSLGGLPPPRLFWNYTDSVQRISVSQQNNKNHSVSTLAAVVKRSADLVLVKCSVGHDALKDTMEAAVNISVQCEFPCLHKSVEILLSQILKSEMPIHFRTPIYFLWLG